MEPGQGEDLERLTSAVRALAGSVAVLAAELRQVQGGFVLKTLATRISAAAEETERVAGDIAARL